MTVVLNRPERLNALHAPAHLELQGAFDELAANPKLQLAIITGAGNRACCVGSDLKSRFHTGRDEFPVCGFAGLANRFDLNKPVIAAINGDAIGGGLEIVLACDLAVSVPGARFGLPEPKVGLAATGGLHRLARQLPAKIANWIALTGELFSARMALEYGLINEIVAPEALLDRVNLLASEILAGAPLSIRATKQMMQRGMDAPTLEAASRGEYPLVERMLSSREVREGMAAFLEGRQPRWQGR